MREIHILVPDLKETTIRLEREPTNLGVITAETPNRAEVEGLGVGKNQRTLKGKQKHKDRLTSQQRGSFMASWARKLYVGGSDWQTMQERERVLDLSSNLGSATD